MADALDLGNTVVKIKKPCMGTVHVPARTREQAGLASAFRTQFLILSTHSVHVCRRCSDIGNIAGKARKTVQGLDFPDYGILATRLDELALMGGYRAEIAASETSPVRID